MPLTEMPSLRDVASLKEAYAIADLRPVAPADERFKRCSEASMVELRDGRVLLAYGKHEAQSDNAVGHVWARTLSPEGAPLGDERIVARAPEGGLNSMSPALHRLPDGRLGMLFSYRIARDLAERRFIASNDEGQTWSEAVIVGSGKYVTGCHDRFLALEDGRLIAPLHGSEHWDKHWPHVTVAWSDDLGRTWRRSARLEMPRLEYPDQRHHGEGGCNEPGVAQRADGSLLMTLRTSMGTQFKSESFDRGETWTPPRSMEVLSPRAPAHLSRMPGRETLLLVYQHDYNLQHSLLGQRHTVVAAISEDGGCSWPHARRKVLACDPKRSIDYPSVLYKGSEVWIALRCSTGADILQDNTSTCLLKVPVNSLLEG